MSSADNSALKAQIKTAIDSQFYYHVTKDGMTATRYTIVDAEKQFGANTANIFLVKARIAGEKDVLVDFLKKNGFSESEVQEHLHYALSSSTYKTGQYKKLYELDLANYKKVEASQPAPKAKATKSTSGSSSTATKPAKTAGKKKSTKGKGKSKAKAPAKKTSKPKSEKAPASNEEVRPLNAYQIWVKTQKKVEPAKLKELWEGVKANAEELQKFEKKAVQMKLAYRRKQRADMPKRPFSAYFLWSTTARADIKKANPTMNIIDIAKALGQKWNTLSAGEKKKFETQASALKVEYNKKMEEYRASHPESKKPTRPTSAFFFFLADQRERLTKSNPSMKITEISKLAKTEWDALQPAGRVRYLERAVADKKRYSREKEGRPTSPLRAEELKAAGIEQALLSKIEARVSPKKAGAKSPSKAAPAPVTAGKKK